MRDFDAAIMERCSYVGIGKHLYNNHYIVKMAVNCHQTRLCWCVAQWHQKAFKEGLNEETTF